MVNSLFCFTKSNENSFAISVFDRNDRTENREFLPRGDLTCQRGGIAWSLDGPFLPPLNARNMMRKTTMPDDSGWYWIKTDGLTESSWAMAYLDIQDDEIELMVFRVSSHAPMLAANMTHFRFSHDVNSFQDCDGSGAFMPTQWAGPLLDPNDEWASMDCHFSSEIHDKASRQNHAMVGIVVDRTYCSKTPDIISSFATIPEDETDETDDLVDKFWNMLEEQATSTR